MQRPKVFVSHWMPEVGIHMLREHCDVDYYDGIEPLAKPQFIARAQHADAVLAFVCDHIDADIVEACPQVRVLSSFGKGYDNIDVEACTSRNVLVTVNPTALTESTADLAIGLLLALSRNLLSGDRHVRSAQFRGWHAVNGLGRDFHHARLGIIGFGSIGQAIARRAQGFDVQTFFYDKQRDIHKEQAPGAQYMELRPLLNQSDFVITAVDLKPENRHLINGDTLNEMKPGSFLINISRGSIVDEQAVSAALRQGRLAGYAADVFEFEDVLIPDRPSYINGQLLQEIDKTVFTPHIGTGTIEARERLAISSVTQLLDALRGNMPVGAVNDVRLEPLLSS